MSRGWRIGLSVVVALVAVNVLFRVLDSVTGGTPGGPQSSSYATSARGVAAYAELLGRYRHDIVQERSLPRSAALNPGATVFLLDPPDVASADLSALHTFVEDGGRLVVAGVQGEQLRALGAPAVRTVRGGKLESVSGLGDVRRIRTERPVAWRISSRSSSFVLERPVGRGRLYLLADASPLQNRLLADADNAALGIALAGPPSRPAEFLETYHGYGRSSGLSALPLSWKLLLGGLALAALVWLVARGRRFGPAEPEGRELAPARRIYVDSLASVIARSRQRDAAVEPVRTEARRALRRRFSLSHDAGDEDLRAAAKRLNVPDDEIAALLGSARSDVDVLAVGRAFARIGEYER